jgi:hypothetical protein
LIAVNSAPQSFPAPAMALHFRSAEAIAAPWLSTVRPVPHPRRQVR